MVLGKGGVGKTTCAAALGLRTSSTGSRTLVLSTDPARALPSVLDQEIGSRATRVTGTSLDAQSLDANELREAFMRRWGDVIRTILDRGTYLDDADIAPLVDTAMPGSDEIFAALKLAELVSERGVGFEVAGLKSNPKSQSPDHIPYRRILVDTAPTGHTLRLLALPHSFRALVRLLDAMQAKHRLMVRTLTRAYRADEADAFLREMTTLVDALDAALRDPVRCAAVMVANAQPVVVEETRRYLAALADLRIAVAALVWNAVDRDDELPDLGVANEYVAVRLDEWPVGRAGLERWSGALEKKPARAQKRGRRSAKPAARRRPERRDPSVLLRPLTIVAGKGGVGKTTVAATLALVAARSGRTLVVSTDPAPSLADVFAQPIPDADTPITGVPSLAARQMDASTAFTRLRTQYQDRVDALFDGLMAKGIDLAQDRAIVRDLLALAPPGVDEVYALSLVADALFKDRYQCVIVDPAPTGHLLRLLEMPQLALAWTHQLMRLMLKYKDIAGLGETAAELLQFSRDLRSVDALLRDAIRCGLVLVVLDEPVVLAESERLRREALARGVTVAGVVLNRAEGSAAALPATGVPMHFQAPVSSVELVGTRALRRWEESWIDGS